MQIRFEPGDTYLQRGDYWLIPARIATGAVLWPTDDSNEPAALPPKEIKHSYAPLWAFFNATTGQDCRRLLPG